MSEVKSIALWCDVDRDDVLTSLKDNMLLHVNYWHFPSDHENAVVKKESKSSSEPEEVPDILDIGLMVPRSDGLKKISIYLPFIITLDEIEDISPLLKESNVAGAIFNEAVTSLGEIELDNFRLTLGGNDFCRIRPFHNEEGKLEDDSLKLTKVGEKGVILSITENSSKTIFYPQDNQIQTYFRLRVSLGGGNKKTFVKSIKPHDSKLNSGYDTTEFIDFRINESRLLPKIILEPMISQQSKTFIPASRIDFLLAVNLEADITGARKEFHKSRFLEPTTWKHYFKGKSNHISKHLKEGMLVYHWKKIRSDETKNKENLDDFIAFVRLKIRISNNKTKKEFVKAAFYIGLLGSLVGSVIFSTILWGFSFFSSYNHHADKQVVIAKECEMSNPLVEKKALDSNLIKTQRKSSTEQDNIGNLNKQRSK